MTTARSGLFMRLFGMAFGLAGAREVADRYSS
jgi:hypothetical protein